MHIIGLGAPGRNIAELFAQYPQYNVFVVDDEVVDNKKDNITYIQIRSCPKPEKYERVSVEKIKQEFKKIKTDEEVYCILSGASVISGIVLKMLETIKRNKNINILYIKPSLFALNETKRRQERVVFGVLQEFARSGLFKRIFLLSNDKILEIIGNVPIREYFEKINHLIVNVFHAINIFENTNYEVGSDFKPLERARISTIRILNLQQEDDDKGKSFFDLDNISEKHYYYAVNKDTLQNDDMFLNKIENRIRKDLTKDIKVSYGVYEVESEQNFGYVLDNTYLTQANKA